MLSASDLQVLDLKAAGALSCSYVVCVSHTVSCDIKLAQPFMHHAPYRAGVAKHHMADTKESGILQTHAPRRCQTLGIPTQHHTACMAAARHSGMSAAASGKAASAAYPYGVVMLSEHACASKAMPAATFERSERPGACPARAQHRGRRYGQLERSIPTY